MNHSEFRIGGEFLCSDRRFRCTDVGTRIVTAIRVDHVEIGSSTRGEPPVFRTISGAEAEAEGWFRGPPYTVAEFVFDEDDQEGCEPV